ncbi:MAG: hypothetical protein JW990_00885, partial [Thermoleophilia bacterium]|nr:hypothetical protein [Thermoleophilia bacterium]
EIDDRIHLWVSGPAEIAEMLAVHGDWVKKETLALSLEVSSAGDETTAASASDAADGTIEAAGARAGAYRESLKVNGLPVIVEVAKA